MPLITRLFSVELLGMARELQCAVWIQVFDAKHFHLKEDDYQVDHPIFRQTHMKSCQVITLLHLDFLALKAREPLEAQKFSLVDPCFESIVSACVTFREPSSRLAEVDHQSINVSIHHPRFENEMKIGSLTSNNPKQSFESSGKIT